MASTREFLDRIFEHLPAGGVKDYLFQHWALPGRPTDEGFGLLRVPGVDAERLLARVMDVDHYLSNVGFVSESRSIPDPAYDAPRAVRFYQRVKIPLIGEMHQELVLERLESRGGFEVAAWHMLERETAALSTKIGIRSQVNEGAWLVGPDLVGYALSSAPRREDVGLLKWKAMTTGANVAASKVVRDNIEGMARWAARP
jgi:hypothetical protein